MIEAIQVAAEAAQPAAASPAQSPQASAYDIREFAAAFDRGGALAVATRLPVGLAARGWGDTVLLRHSGPTVDLLTGRRFVGTEVALAELLERYPVALLGPEDAP